MSVTTTSDIELAVRTWLLDPLVLGLTAAQVIIAHPPGPRSSPRPAMPYLTVHVPTSEKLGEDWVEQAPSAPPFAALTPRGERQATVSLQGFGAATAEWLERLSLRAHLPAVVALEVTLGIAVRGEGPLREITALRDTSHEPRFAREITVGYQVADAPSNAVAYATSETMIEYDRYPLPDPDPLIDVVVTP